MNSLQQIKIFISKNSHFILFGTIILLLVILLFINNTNNHINNADINETYSCNLNNDDSNILPNLTNSNNSTNNTNNNDNNDNNLSNNLVLYYASWCGYSRQFLPIWQQFQQTYPDIKVKTIECTDSNKNICENIPGYPTIRYHKSATSYVDFNGERTVDGLYQFIQTNQ